MADPIDMQGCEHCGKEFPIETMHMMEDCWMCDACVTEWKKEFDACAHEWAPYINEFGEDSKICHKCNGVVPAQTA